MRKRAQYMYTYAYIRISNLIYYIYTRSKKKRYSRKMEKIYETLVTHLIIMVPRCLKTKMNLKSVFWETINADCVEWIFQWWITEWITGRLAKLIIKSPVVWVARSESVGVAQWDKKHIKVHIFLFKMRFCETLR